LGRCRVIFKLNCHDKNTLPICTTHAEISIDSTILNIRDFSRSRPNNSVSQRAKVAIKHDQTLSNDGFENRWNNRTGKCGPQKGKSRTPIAQGRRYTANFAENRGAVH
jgi:hypothetical protein